MRANPCHKIVLCDCGCDSKSGPDHSDRAFTKMINKTHFQINTDIFKETQNQCYLSKRVKENSNICAEIRRQDTSLSLSNFAR